MEFQTTFWKDFSIAEKSDILAIETVFYDIFEKSKNNCEYLTELVIILDQKLWIYYEKNNNEYADKYMELYSIARDYAINTLKDDELEYYLKLSEQF